MAIENRGFPQRNGVMYESLTLRRKSRIGVVSDVQVKMQGEFLGSGTEGYVERVDVCSNKAPEKVISLASKVFYEGESPYVPYEDLFSNYDLVVTAGLPAPQTFRARDDEKGIVMTDLTDRGKNLVVSYQDITPGKLAAGYKDKQENMRNYADLHTGSPDGESPQIRQYASKAAQAGLFLPIDAWFAVIAQDGNLQYVVGDFAQIKRFEEPQDEQSEALYTFINTTALKRLTDRLQIIEEFGKSAVTE